MTRVKRGMMQRARHKRVLKRAKGYRGRHRTVYRIAKQLTTKGTYYAWRDRRTKKRDKRSLWILQINAACRANNITYSKFIAGMKKKQVELDRKVLAEIADTEPKVFTSIVDFVKAGK